MTVARCASVLVLLLVLPAAASAQRDRFFGTLPALYRSLAGVYGDEGKEIAAHVETLSQALAAWDRDLAEAAAGLRARLKDGNPRTALEVRVTLSTLYAERSRFADALREIDEAIRINPRSPGLYRYKALLHDSRGQPVEAAAALRTAWQLDPKDPVNAYWLIVKRSRATTAAEIEQAAATLTIVERELVRRQRRITEPPFVVLSAINDDVGRATPFAPAAYARSFALLRGGEFAAGLAALKAAVAADPLLADPAMRLEPTTQGIAAQFVGLVPEAIAFLERAATQSPRSSEVQRLLGTAYAVNGDTAQGVEHLRAAVKLNPENERAWLTLARTLESVD